MVIFHSYVSLPEGIYYTYTYYFPVICGKTDDPQWLMTQILKDLKRKMTLRVQSVWPRRPCSIIIGGFLQSWPYVFFFFRKPRVTSWWFGSSNHRTLSFESPMLINNPRKALVVHLFSSMSFLSTFSTLFIRSTLGFLWFSWFLVLFPLSLVVAPLVGPRFWVFSAGKSPNICWWHSQSLLHIPSGKHTKNGGKSPCLMGKSTIDDHFQ